MPDWPAPIRTRCLAPPWKRGRKLCASESLGGSEPSRRFGGKGPSPLPPCGLPVAPSRHLATSLPRAQDRPRSADAASSADAAILRAPALGSVGIVTRAAGLRAGPARGTMGVPRNGSHRKQPVVIVLFSFTLDLRQSSNPHFHRCLDPHSLGPPQFPSKPRRRKRLRKRRLPMDQKDLAKNIWQTSAAGCWKREPQHSAVLANTGERMGKHVVRKCGQPVYALVPVLFPSPRSVGSSLARAKKRSSRREDSWQDKLRRRTFLSWLEDWRAEAPGTRGARDDCQERYELKELRGSS